jgi:4a-hydroxytetrahydrobiopterin dehydratase
MERRKLSAEEIEAALNHLQDWQLEDGKLHKTFKFNSFAQAIGWMVSVAIFADKMDHHPEWTNVYNRVSVDLVTHDLGNVISSLDVALAQKMEASFQK